MTFRDVAEKYIATWFNGLHAVKPQLTWREYLAAFADAVTTAAADVAGKATHLDPGAGVEVDVSTDYDPASGTLTADIYLRMVGTPSYIAASGLLTFGFVYLAEYEAYHVGLTVPMASLKELR